MRARSASVIASICAVLAAGAASAAPEAKPDTKKDSAKSDSSDDAKSDAKKDSAKSDAKKDSAKSDKKDKSDAKDSKDSKDSKDAKDAKDAKKSDKKDSKKDTAKKDEPPPPPPRTPGPEDAKVKALLDKIVAAPDNAARKALADEVNQLAPHAMDAIAEWLARPHDVDVAERRKVLGAIKADIPDKTGRFQVPERTKKQQQENDEMDWLTLLVALDPAMPGIGEVIADDAAIRALGVIRDIHAAQLVFDVAFLNDTMIMRDECGRYLRRMEPYSIPTLTKESQSSNYDRKRYSTFQIERLDRQDPLKALGAAAGDESLQIAILDVFRQTKLREAVHAVWTMVDNADPKIRAAARAAWMDYITGPPPPPAPRAKLNLPGGKQTKVPKPLWLTYRELADNELRKALNEIFHEDYPLDDPSLDDTDRVKKTVAIDLVEKTKQLFDYFDAERSKRDAAQWAAAKKTADSGDLAGAAGAIDRMIATNPERPERGDMAKVYFAFGKQLEGAQKWADASAAYSKAHGLDPKGASATEALAGYHYTLGKSLEAQGKDGGPELRRAMALKPDYTPAKSTVEHSSSSASRPTWMLYAAGVAVVVALMLFGAAMMRRRARAS